MNEKTKDEAKREKGTYLNQEDINRGIENLKNLCIANHAGGVLEKIVEEALSGYFKIERNAKKKEIRQILKTKGCEFKNLIHLSWMKLKHLL